MDRDPALATVFGTAVEQYDAGRPGYPDAAVDWMLPPGRCDVLDLGAGTGKLTASLVARRLHVLAVEPSDPMRHRLRELWPLVDARAGTAESTGLPDGCVDAVVVGQAWHWFDEAAAAREVSRVLRPRGRLGLVWNRLDVSVPWVAAVHDLMATVGGPQEGDPAPALGAGFLPSEQLTVTWSHRLAREAVRSLVASRSYVVALTAPARERLLTRVDDVVHQLAPPGPQVEVPYLSRCWRATVR